MGKSIMSFFNRQEKEKQKDFENRAKQFLGEYNVIRRRYQCDLRAFIKMKDGGAGGFTPEREIVDATAQIKLEEALELKAAEAAEKQRLEGNQNQEKKLDNIK